MTGSRVRPRLAAATTLVGLVLMTAAPATAAAAPVVDVFFPTTTIAESGPGVREGVIAFTTEPVTLRHAVVTYDYSDIDGFVAISGAGFGSSGCSALSPSVLACGPFPFDTTVHGASGLGLDIIIEPTATAVEGDEGTLRVTLTADGIGPVSHDARVRVGGGVDLAAFEPNLEREGAPGQAVPIPLSVANVGDSVANGATVLFFSDYALAVSETFSNCTYTADGIPRICRFSTDLQPGEAYGVSFPYRLRTDTFAPGLASAEHLWLTPAELEDHLEQLARFDFDTGTPGTGPALELEPVVAISARSVQADVDPHDNWSTLNVTVTGNNNGVDLAAIGATLSGKVGDVVTATLGLMNNGPATVDSSRGGSSVTTVYVTVPPGTTAVDVPDRCLPLVDGRPDFAHPGQPGAAKYACGSGFLLIAGRAETFDVELRIDTAITDATGTVSILEPCECDGFPPDRDTNNSNNQAKIIVNPKPAPLASTGTSMTGLIAAGAGLVLTGLLIVVFAVRRRVRPRH